MAIKGKSKSKTPKAIARGPKPAYVPVKRPLLTRRGVWIPAVAVLGALLVAGIVYGFAQERTESRERELERARAEAFQVYGRQVEPIIGTVGDPVDPASWSSFTELEDALDQLEAGLGRPPKLVGETAAGAASRAGTAWGAFDQIDAVGIVRGRGLDQEFVLFVVSSEEKLIDSLKLYEQAAELLVLATEAPSGDQRDALMERARGVFDVARSLFDSGFGDYIEASTLAGLLAEASTGNISTVALPTGPTG